MTAEASFPPMPLRMETERLALTPEEERDAEWFAELLNARGRGTFTIGEAPDRIATMTATIQATCIGALALRTKPEADTVGYVHERLVLWALDIRACRIEVSEVQRGDDVVVAGEVAGIRRRTSGGAAPTIRLGRWVVPQ